ncbi:MAG: FGGY family carbohydrate kinase [Pseudomonadota bacterium]
MTARDPIFIGIDLGTSSVKAVMGGAGGALLDVYTSAHETMRTEPGAAEQDPAIWLKHVDEAILQFSTHARASDVVAIGVTSQVNTHVFCDASVQPLRPAITWQDTRSAEHAALLEQAVSDQKKIAALGAPIPIDASHALSRMAWVANSDTSLWRATEHVLLPKDLVIAHLTGTICADPISAIGLVGEDHTYASPILDLVARAADVLPPLSDPLSIVANVAKHHPFAGTPVCCGTMDAWASMFGLGVASNGQAMYLSGTSEVLGLISAGGAGYPGIITFPNWRGIRLHAGPTQSGGASLLWLSQILGMNVEELVSRANGLNIKPDTPMFLPHLEGERAPLWDPVSRASFSGLTSAHGPNDLIMAVMEGVAFSARHAIEAIERSGDRKIDRLRLGGGGSASNDWCRIRANALGRTLERVANRDAGAMGALVMAGAASGRLSNLIDATSALVRTESVFEPDPAETSIGDERFDRFRQLYHQLKPIGVPTQAA